MCIKAIWAVNTLESYFSLMGFMETHQQHMIQSREWSPCIPKHNHADQGSAGASGAATMSLEMLNRGLNHRSFVREACPGRTLHQEVRLQLEWKTAALYISPDAFELPDHKTHCRPTTDPGWTCTHTHTKTQWNSELDLKICTFTTGLPGWIKSNGKSVKDWNLQNFCSIAQLNYIWGKKRNKKRNK